MSKADLSDADRLKEHLMSGDPKFRELSPEQRRCEAPERTIDELFPEPRTRLIEAAFAAHAEYLESGRGPLSIDEINAEVAERRGGAREDASR